MPINLCLSDGLADCMDPDCCLQPSCQNQLYCKGSPDPAEVLSQSPSSLAPQQVGTHSNVTLLNESIPHHTDCIWLFVVSCSGCQIFLSADPLPGWSWIDSCDHRREPIQQKVQKSDKWLEWRGNGCCFKKSAGLKSFIIYPPNVQYEHFQSQREKRHRWSIKLSFSLVQESLVETKVKGWIICVFADIIQHCILSFSFKKNLCRENNSGHTT